MYYLESFRLPSDRGINQYFTELRETCYNNFYPMKVFYGREFPTFTFEPITIFYGDNGSGKSTILNALAAALGFSRGAVYNRSSFFDDYVEMCSAETTDHFTRAAAERSKILTSDDVFSYLHNVRSLNQGIDDLREECFRDWLQKRDVNYKLKSLDDYETFKQYAEASRASKSEFTRRRVAKNIEEYSNGESALNFFQQSIHSDALYLLDEPENSLSATHQSELAEFIVSSARFYHCQFVISTHSPFLLAMKGAKIYDLDSDPIGEQVWTQLPTVHCYYQFFQDHNRDFEGND